MQNNHFVLACDIGGTHITSAIVDISDWSILEGTITRSHVNSRADAKTIFQDWTSNMQACLDKAPGIVSQIGIAMPGPFDYENGIALMKDQAKYDDLYQMAVTQPILDGLTTPIESIRYINDAAAFLQGEVFLQNLDHEDSVLGITLGTGLGSAVWRKGEKAFDADLWNSSYKDSIFEEHLVTRWFTRRFHELSNYLETGLKEILEKHTDHQATETLLNEYLEHLRDFLIFFSEKHGSSKFIIGGNISKAWNAINGINPEKLRQFDIRLGQYQEFAAIIGAASLHRT